MSSNDHATRVTQNLNAGDHAVAAHLAGVLWRTALPGDLDNRDDGIDAATTRQCLDVLSSHSSGQITIEAAYAADGARGTALTRVIVVVDDSPFIVDSVLIALSHDGLHTHHFSNVVTSRDSQNNIIPAGESGSSTGDVVLVYAETDPLTDDEITHLVSRLREALENVAAAIADFASMRNKLTVAKTSLAESPNAAAREESETFLDWLSDHFVFLGYREFDYSGGTMQQVADSALGVLRRRPPATTRLLSDQHQATRDYLLEPEAITFSKSGTRLNVHRHAYPDYVGVRRFDAAGNVVGEAGFLGLYTSKVYQMPTADIPLIRTKLARILDAAPFRRAGFDAKVLQHVLETYPRDELFESRTEDIGKAAVAVAYIHDRRRTRVFTRVDPYGLFVNAMVYVPRDLYNTYARRHIQDVLMNACAAADCEFEPYFSESSLVRLQLVLRLNAGVRPQLDDSSLTRQIEALIADWTLELRQSLTLTFGQSVASTLLRLYETAFPAGYRDQHTALQTCSDIATIEKLKATEPLQIKLSHAAATSDHTINLRIFTTHDPLDLSAVVPKLEHLGFGVANERRFTIKRPDQDNVCLQEFALRYDGNANWEIVNPILHDCLADLWLHGAEDDTFNKVVVPAELTGRQVGVLRAYAHYLKQLVPAHSIEFTSATLHKHAPIAAMLIGLFEARLDPASTADEAAVVARIHAELDKVPALNEDAVLRRMCELIQATDRTSYFRQDATALALKIAPRRIADIPRPVPLAEIFVFSHNVEGVHLRDGMVARGGLRWSDRYEDYRTEVLGLVRAQIVKNAVIVPTGAKGGFVTRNGCDAPTAYNAFIGGLLSVTDNLDEAGNVVPPLEVVRRDGDDPYLVVAADKGTATFSDLANAAAITHGFWLGDAFASGGSNGYDHKLLGITARGAWTSVERHFLERGIKVANDPITVLGVGDMAGDVFGNGMLQSSALKLVGAFNHRHIFIDPDPNCASAFTERQRLFALAGSAWSDYDPAVISAGGGVFERSAKVILLSPEMQLMLDTSETSLAPDALIRLMLMMKVDLLFNGGIGTYVKSADEANSDVGDKANDALRVDGRDLRCKVLAEGGNLGITQLGRIEFALHGGAINADFIDNSAGVDCSDHEVNLKIALGEGERQSPTGMSAEARSETIRRLALDVVRLVLANSAGQARAIALAQQHSKTSPTEYVALMDTLARSGRLDPVFENLPLAEEVFARGFTRPELAVLMAHAKMYVKAALLGTAALTDPRAQTLLTSQFPPEIAEQHALWLQDHPLRQEIIATGAANEMVHTMGPGFVFEMTGQTGRSLSDVVLAWWATSEILDIGSTIAQLEASDDRSTDVQDDAMLNLMRLGRRVTRWLLKAHDQIVVNDLAALYKPALADVNLAPEVALPLIHAALQRNRPFAQASANYAALQSGLQLDALERVLTQVPVITAWQAMEQAELEDDVVRHHAGIAATADDVEVWLRENSASLNEFQHAIEQIAVEPQPDQSALRVLTRRLARLDTSARH